MPIDTTVPESPGWWLERLLKDLASRQADYDLLDHYYRGDAPMPWVPDNCRDAARRFMSKARANWGPLIVEAVRTRMVVTGFRTAAANDELGDKEALRIWDANNMGAVSKNLFRTKLSLREAYAIVGPVDPEIGAPLITAEDPRQVVTAANPADRRRTLAGLKVFADDINAADRAYLYLPGMVLQADRKRGSNLNGDGIVDLSSGGWEWRSLQQLPFKQIPVVHFPNRADLYGRTMGEFEDVLNDIDRINLMLLQRLTVAVMQAFRQRAVKGDLPETDNNGAPIDYGDLFRADPGALWQLPPGVDMWESAGVDLTPLLESVKADVRDLAATTFTPMFYLFPDAANGSAEGASLQREGLVFKTQDRIDETADPLERTMALAFLQSGQPERAVRAGLKSLWAPPERFTLAERASAATQATAAGVPWRTVMTDVMQFPPQKVDEMEVQRRSEALLAPQMVNQVAVGA